MVHEATIDNIPFLAQFRTISPKQTMLFSRLFIKKYIENMMWPRVRQQTQ